MLPGQVSFIRDGPPVEAGRCRGATHLGSSLRSVVDSPSRNVEVLADAARQLLSSRGGIVAAYLFGSTARGVAEPGDLDIAVMFAPGVDGFEAALALHVDMELQLDFPVDVHDFDALPSDLQFRVLDEGRLLVDIDRRARTRRAVTAQLMYYDFKPYLDRIRQGAIRRMVSGPAHG
jgi:predicted nucleotidyltransferase